LSVWFNVSNIKTANGGVQLNKIEEKIMAYFTSIGQKIDLTALTDNFASTQAVKASFHLSRTNASKLINRLVEKKVLFKINTRPVLFADRSSFANKYQVPIQDSYQSLEAVQTHLKQAAQTATFHKMIGYNKSLAEAIEQMKTAVFYPGKGLPMMITGATGVGKSYFAEITHEFMINAGVIAAAAPFKRLNCAQYYNNPELLSGLLFGYCEGAFTGAVKDQPGLLEEADQGVLFLDEVHRLSPQGQEKLFTFMDNGTFARIGELRQRQANVRLIFATTEPEEAFLGTFLRRIPIQVYIPALKERDLVEKKQIIDYLYRKESTLISQRIEVTPRVINVLLQSEYQGNIGELENAIKYSCGSAVSRRRDSETTIVIHLRDLPGNVYQTLQHHETAFNLEGANLCFDPQANSTLHSLVSTAESNPIFAKIAAELRKENTFTKAGTEPPLTERLTKMITNFADELIYQTQMDTHVAIEKFIVETMQELFREFSKRYKIRYDGDFVTSVSHYIYKYVLKNRSDSFAFPLELETVLRKYYEQEWAAVKKLLPAIKNRLDIVFSPVDQVMITLFFSTLNYEKSTSQIDALIVAHGYATASSISNVVNKMLGSRIFAAIDMPIDSSVFDISEKILDYLAGSKVNEGILIIIDMGSLNLLYNELKRTMDVPLLFVDQLNTVMALEIGNLIDQGKGLEEISRKIDEPLQPHVQLYLPARRRTHAIITTCFTGIGTAVQIQQLLMDCFEGIMEVQIFPIEFGSLKSFGISKEISKKYEVKAIIGTDDPQIPEIEFIYLEQLISGDNSRSVNQFFATLLPEKQVAEVNNRLVKSFSLIRVIDSLTILDTKKIIKIIEACLGQFEQRLHLTLSNVRKISLYVHISCMVERLIRQTDIQEFPELEKFMYQHQKEIRVIQDILSVIESTYSVNITLPEIGYIHTIIYSS
jgi:sigma-54 dependent transcriptional regulator of gfr operon